MKKEMLRKGSIGLAGTLQNAECHAKDVVELVKDLAARVDKLDVKLWRQGHNMHILVTNDDRMFVFRPLNNLESGCNGGNYGIQFSSKINNKKSTEVPLLDITVKSRISKETDLDHAMTVIKEIIK